MDINVFINIHFIHIDYIMYALPVFVYLIVKFISLYIYIYIFIGYKINQFKKKIKEKQNFKICINKSCYEVDYYFHDK